MWVSGSHIGLMMAFPEHQRWIMSAFNQRSIMNWLYLHNQQVGYLCFIPFVWEQRGVIAAVAHPTLWFHTISLRAKLLRDGHEGMWAWFGSQVSIALNWHSHYNGMRYSGTWLYLGTYFNQDLSWPSKPDHSFVYTSGHCRRWHSHMEVKIVAELHIFTWWQQRSDSSSDFLILWQRERHFYLYHVKFSAEFTQRYLRYTPWNFAIL